MRHVQSILLMALLSTSAHAYQTRWMSQVVEKSACLEALGAVVSNPDSCWSWTRRETAGPLVLDSKIFVGGTDGHLHVVEPVKGQTKKRVRLVGNLVSKPTSIDNDLVLATDKGSVYRMRSNDLSIIWKVEVDSGVLQTPYVAKDKVVVVTQLGTVYALRVTDGTVAWTQKRELPNRIFLKHMSTPILVETLVNGTSREVLAVGSPSGRLEFFDSQKGDRVDETVLGSKDLFGDVATTPVLADGILYVASYNNGLVAIDAKSRVQKWNVKEKGLTEIAVANEVVVVAGAKIVMGIDAKSGRKLWSFPFSKGAPTAIHIKGSEVFVGSDLDGLYVLDLVKGPKQTLGSGLGFASQVVEFEDHILAMSSAGALFFFNSTDLVVSGRQVALKGIKSGR